MKYKALEVEFENVDVALVKALFNTNKNFTQLDSSRYYLESSIDDYGRIKVLVSCQIFSINGKMVLKCYFNLLKPMVISIVVVFIPMVIIVIETQNLSCILLFLLFALILLLIQVSIVTHRVRRMINVILKKAPSVERRC